MNPTERTIATTSSPSDALPGEGWAQRFFELAVDPLAVVGYDGAFKRVNPFWEQLFGWPAAELLARPYAEFVHPDDREGLERALRGLIENAAPGRDVELRFRCRDGSYRWLSVSGQASREEQLVYVVAKDVTGRRRAEQALRHSEERFRSVIAALDEGIVVQDADGVIQACNTAAERILGTSAEAMRAAAPDSPPWRGDRPGRAAADPGGASVGADAAHRRAGHRRGGGSGPRGRVGRVALGQQLSARLSGRPGAAGGRLLVHRHHAEQGRRGRAPRGGGALPHRLRRRPHRRRGP